MRLRLKIIICVLFFFEQTLKTGPTVAIATQGLTSNTCRHPAARGGSRWTLSSSWARQGNKPVSGLCWLIQNLPSLLPHSSAVPLLHWKPWTVEVSLFSHKLLLHHLRHRPCEMAPVQRLLFMVYFWVFYCAKIPWMCVFIVTLEMPFYSSACLRVSVLGSLKFMT